MWIIFKWVGVVPEGSRIQGCEWSAIELADKNAKELKGVECLVKVIRTLFKDISNNSKIPKGSPRKEWSDLTSQIRRSAVSIPSNIAKGYGRKTTLDYIRMLYISYGSVCELETQILLTGDLGFIDKSELNTAKKDIAEIERMLKALIKSLEHKHLNPWPLESLDPLLQLIWRRTIFSWPNDKIAIDIHFLLI